LAVKLLLGRLLRLFGIFYCNLLCYGGKSIYKLNISLIFFWLNIGCFLCIICKYKYIQKIIYLSKILTSLTSAYFGLDSRHYEDYKKKFGCLDSRELILIVSVHVYPEYIYYLFISIVHYKQNKYFLLFVLFVMKNDFLFCNKQRNVTKTIWYAHAQSVGVCLISMST
jgi:hypothetical protein